MYRPKSSVSVSTEPQTFHTTPWLIQHLHEVEQRYQTHNAGQLAFGPQGMPYIGTGNGGLKDDPF
ncbi:MAG: hypothetical protein ACJAZO_000145 [Myxococcota bacterium]